VSNEVQLVRSSTQWVQQQKMNRQSNVVQRSPDMTQITVDH